MNRINSFNIYYVLIERNDACDKHLMYTFDEERETAESGKMDDGCERNS